MSYLLDSYCVPGTALSKSHASSHLILAFEAGFFFFYSHLQMKELKFRVNTLPKVRYLVPIRTHIWEDEQVTEPIPLSMRVLN